MHNQWRMVHFSLAAWDWVEWSCINNCSSWDAICSCNRSLINSRFFKAKLCWSYMSSGKKMQLQNWRSRYFIAIFPVARNPLKLVMLSLLFCFCFSTSSRERRIQTRSWKSNPLHPPPPPPNCGNGFETHTHSVWVLKDGCILLYIWQCLSWSYTRSHEKLILRVFSIMMN